MKSKKCPWNKTCRNGGSNNCYTIDPSNCVRYLPIEGTNLTEITGIIETPPGY